jgi:hypothetical protein
MIPNIMHINEFQSKLDIRKLLEVLDDAELTSSMPLLVIHYFMTIKGTLFKTDLGLRI